MQFPANATLPFFAYGAFRVGELAFLRVKPFVEHADTTATFRGELKVRDGLLLVSPNSSATARGHLLDFRTTNSGSAYSAIAELEPERQYEWTTQTIATSSGDREANVLVGKDVANGSSSPDRDLKNADDPFFKEALELVDSYASQYSSTERLGGNTADMTNLLKLQMAYMLLWSSIERYATLRYSLGDQVMGKVLAMADEPTFRLELARLVNRRDTLYAANEPSDKRKKTLNAQSPKKSLEYYYQVRCNITHRGKGAFDDFARLLSCVKELSRLFRACLATAFKEASEFPTQPQ